MALDISRRPQYLFIENDSQIGMDVWAKTETAITDTARAIPAADRDRDSDPDREALPDRDRVRDSAPEDVRDRDMVQASRMVPV
ncbi:MAG: hypothetical protein ACP5IA_03945, partial [Sediminispirochaetaceae bacterium]